MSYRILCPNTDLSRTEKTSDDGGRNTIIQIQCSSHRSIVHVSGIGMTGSKKVEASDEELGEKRVGRRITESIGMKILMEASDCLRRKETP